MAKTSHWPIWKSGLNLWRKPKMATEAEKEDEEGWGRKQDGAPAPLPGLLPPPGWPAASAWNRGGLRGGGGGAEPRVPASLALLSLSLGLLFLAWLSLSTGVNKGPVWSPGQLEESGSGAGAQPRRTPGLRGAACSCEGECVSNRSSRAIRCSRLHHGKKVERFPFTSSTRLKAALLGVSLSVRSKSYFWVIHMGC